jgi:hypothetical protein
MLALMKAPALLASEGPSSRLKGIKRWILHGTRSEQYRSSSDLQGRPGNWVGPET